MWILNWPLCLQIGSVGSRLSVQGSPGIVISLLLLVATQSGGDKRRVETPEFHIVKRLPDIIRVPWTSWKVISVRRVVRELVIFNQTVVDVGALRSPVHCEGVVVGLSFIHHRSTTTDHLQ